MGLTPSQLESTCPVLGIESSRLAPWWKGPVLYRRISNHKQTNDLSYQNYQRNGFCHFSGESNHLRHVCRYGMPVTCFRCLRTALRWRHNDHAGVSNHQPHGCLLNRLFRRKSKKTSKLRVTGLCAGNSPGTGEFPAQMASYAENVSIWWRHHGAQRKICELYAWSYGEKGHDDNPPYTTVPERKFVSQIRVRYQDPRWWRQQSIRMFTLWLCLDKDS